MQILTVPNWSFARHPLLSPIFEGMLSSVPLNVHYYGADVDHNRTVTAFSGEAHEVTSFLSALTDSAFRVLDMRQHRGVHPRVGVLDVCPFIPLEEGPNALREALAIAEKFASRLAQAYELPVFLYEKSERGRHEADLPTLRKGGYEGLFGRELRPDFGPTHANVEFGAAVIGVRDFLIAFNVDLETQDLEVARDIAKEMRVYRADGDPRFLGVRALGFPLASRQLSQISINLTLPDLTAVDPIVDWIETRAADDGILVAATELIGVIRDRDVRQATELRIEPRQVVHVNASA